MHPLKEKLPPQTGWLSTRSETSYTRFQMKMTVSVWPRKGKRSQNQGQNMTIKSQCSEWHPVAGLHHPTAEHRAEHGTTQQTTVQEHLPRTRHVWCWCSHWRWGQHPQTFLKTGTAGWKQVTEGGPFCLEFRFCWADVFWAPQTPALICLVNNTEQKTLINKIINKHLKLFRLFLWQHVSL